MIGFPSKCLFHSMHDFSFMFIFHRCLLRSPLSSFQSPSIGNNWWALQWWPCRNGSLLLKHRPWPLPSTTPVGARCRIGREIDTVVALMVVDVKLGRKEGGLVAHWLGFWRVSLSLSHRVMLTVWVNYSGINNFTSVPHSNALSLAINKRINHKR